MKTRLIIALIVVILIIAGVYLFSLGGDNSDSKREEGSSGESEEGSDSEDAAESPSDEENFEEETVHVVEVNEKGFEPLTIEIKKGESVVWMAGDVQRFWIASNNHPTHTRYPNSSIEKCGTSNQSSTFDACRVYFTGENYSFKFDRVGSWGYHDHIRAWAMGTVVVNE